ncbi:MAG: aminopeptidase [Bacteroidaceae bacterium]|nr:aminopeptidase [Bacteroidaceae bacterium]
MRTTRISVLIINILLLCCTGHNDSKEALYDCGISLQLAQQRKNSIKEPEYDLFFSIPEKKDYPVEGNAKISFVIDTPQEIIIDYRDTDNIEKVIVNDNETVCELRNEHIIIPASSLHKGRNSIEILFTAANQSLNRNDEFLYTLLVPDRARTLFPCFDQPDLKATFRLSLDIPKGWCAVSNSPVESGQEKEGRTVVSFYPTEPLSTYLFSFVAGEFKKEVYNDGKHTFAAYYRETDPERIAQLPVIFDQVAQSVDWMEEYTGVPYPFAKYDFVILRGFQYGGMEHTGATLYNDTQLFLGKHPTPDEELHRAQLIAHETAHMWFGDLVTMAWFDDVWTKEVFANYFAARMTEPLFPEVNHNLNWLRSIVTPALSEDRTTGGTSIKQPLDNMRNAGLIYNNIIYDKAPVMLEKLIGIMGEEAFREGIQEYLTTFAYGNATWDNLIAILDSRTDADLATFSNTWVNRRGMPHITFSTEGDTLVVRQSDPYGRGLVWQQSFEAMLIGERSQRVTIEVTDTLMRIPLAQTATYILPNSNGKGYGYFIYDSRSLDRALADWHTIDDDVCRLAQLMNLHEAYQHGALDAAQWLQSLVAGLPKEGNPLVVSALCSYIQDPLCETKDSCAESTLLELAATHPLMSCRVQLLRALIGTATSPQVCDRLYTMWEEGAHPLLNENDYMNMAYELAIRFPERHTAIIDAQRARMDNPDRIRQFEFISRAATPDTAEQEALFHTLLKAENRRIEPWALKTLAYLCHHTRTGQAVKYIRPGLEAMQEIQRTSDIFFPQSWARTLLMEHRSIEARKAVEQFLSDNPAYPQLLKNKILRAAWGVFR